MAAVVTQPDKPAGRNQEPLPSPVKVWAEKDGIKLFQPPKLEIGNWKLEIPEAALYVVASYGKLIPDQILNLPRLGSLNIHPSLLPKYRGPSPIHAAILNGDKETGVTIIKLDEQMDHGPILANSKFQITNPKTGYKELHDKLAQLGAELLIQTLPKYIAGEIKPKPQDHSEATFTKIVSKNDGRINWSNPAETTDRQIRAYEVWPVAWTTLDGKRLKIYSAAPMSVIPADEPESRKWIPGQARDDKKQGKLIISCGTGELEILELQLEGSRRMDACDFLNGNPLGRSNILY